MRTALLMVLAAALAGCGTFGKDRARDLAQSFTVAAGWSEGVELNLRATKAVQVGFGSYRGVYWAGLKDGVLDVWTEERSELGIGPLYFHEVFRGEGEDLLDIDHPLFGDPGFREYSWDWTHLTDRGILELGVTANVAVIGVDVAFEPAEAADFVTGFVGFDLLADDVEGVELAELGRRARSDDARRRAAAMRAMLLRTGDDFGYAIYTAPREMPRRQIDALRRLRERLDPASIVYPEEIEPETTAPPANPATPEPDPPATPPAQPAPPAG